MIDNYKMLTPNPKIDKRKNLKKQTNQTNINQNTSKAFQEKYMHNNQEKNNKENSKEDIGIKRKKSDNINIKTDISKGKKYSNSKNIFSVDDKKIIEINDIRNDNLISKDFKDLKPRNGNINIFRGKYGDGQKSDKNNQQVNNNNFIIKNCNNNMNNNNKITPLKENKFINKKNNEKEVLSPPKIIIPKNKENNKNVRSHQNNNKIIENKNINDKINDNTSSEFSFNKFTSHPLVSLSNCGNTSYINVVLQCFANIKNISNDILKHLKIIESNQVKMEMTFYFSRILFHLFPSGTDYEKKYTLQIFYNFLMTKNPIFKGKTTKSAIDFLVYFVDKLDEEYKIIGNNNTKINSILKETEFQSIQKYLKHLLENREDTIIFRTFSWINKKVEKCWECNKECITFQKYFTYDLNIENAINKTIMQYKNIITIHDCIKYASENQIIYNIFCKQCNKKNNKDVKSTIYLSQNLLIFLLRGIEKKENIEDMKSNKIKIQIDKDIDISDLVEDQKNSFRNYTLHGLIYYDIDNQEYFAYCVSPIDVKWYEYIDESIRLADFNNFIGLINDKILPVILFYRHLDNQKNNNKK